MDAHRVILDLPEGDHRLVVQDGLEADAAVDDVDGVAVRDEIVHARRRPVDVVPPRSLLHNKPVVGI